MPGPQRRSRRARKEPPEIVPPKSDEEPNEEEEEESEPESTSRTRRGQRGRKTKTPETSENDGSSSDERKSRDATDTGESSNEEESEKGKKPAPRRRGRPKKTSESNEEKTSRRRGRPRKHPEPSSDDAGSSDEEKESSRKTRTRIGRPRKTPEPSSDDQSSSEDEKEAEQKTTRRRGRPRKSPGPSSNDEGSKSEPVQKSPRRRGRPRKTPEPSSNDESEQEPTQKSPKRRGRSRKSPEPSSDDNNDEEKGSTKKQPRRRGRPRKSPEPSSNDEDSPPTEKTTEGRGRPSKAQENSSTDEGPSGEDHHMRTTRRKSQPANPSNALDKIKEDSSRASDDERADEDNKTEEQSGEGIQDSSPGDDTDTGIDGQESKKDEGMSKKRRRTTRSQDEEKGTEAVSRDRMDEENDEDLSAEGSKNENDKADDGADDVPIEAESSLTSRRLKRQRSKLRTLPESKGDGEDEVRSDNEYQPTKRSRVEHDNSTAADDGAAIKNDISMGIDKTPDSKEAAFAEEAPAEAGKKAPPEARNDDDVESASKAVHEENPKLQNPVALVQGAETSTVSLSRDADPTKASQSHDRQSQATKQEADVALKGVEVHEENPKPQNPVALLQGAETSTVSVSRDADPTKASQSHDRQSRATKQETDVALKGVAEIKSKPVTPSMPHNKSEAKDAEIETRSKRDDPAKEPKTEGKLGERSESTVEGSNRVVAPLKNDVKRHEDIQANATEKDRAQAEGTKEDISAADATAPIIPPAIKADAPPENHYDSKAEQAEDVRKKDDASAKGETSISPKADINSSSENPPPQSAPKGKPDLPRKTDAGDDSDEFHDAQMELPATPVKQVVTTVINGPNSSNGSNSCTVPMIPLHTSDQREAADVPAETAEIRSAEAEGEEASEIRAMEVDKVDGKNGLLKSTSEKDSVHLDLQMKGPESTILPGEQPSTKKEVVVRSITQEGIDPSDQDSKTAASPTQLSSSPVTESSEEEDEIEEETKEPVYETRQLPFNISLVTPPPSNDSEASAFYGYDRNKLNRVKAILYSTGSRVHRGRGFERIFAQYWDAVMLRLSDRLSTHASRQSEVAVKAFLKSPNLRKIHNKFIISIMKRAMKSFALFDQVSGHIPVRWHDRVKRIDRVLVQEPPKAKLSLKLLPGTTKPKDISIYGEAWELMRSDDNPLSEAARQIPSQEVDVKKIHASSSPIPGALVIDPLVREMAERSNMRVSENAIWLLIVAAREHTKNVIRNAVVCKKGIEQGEIPATFLHYPKVLAGTKNPSKRDSIQEKHDRPPLADYAQGKSQSRKVVSSFDIFASSASMPSGCSASLGGSVSSTALERCLHSAFDSSPFVPGADFTNVQNYIVREITSLARERKRLLPPPIEKKHEHTSHGDKSHKKDSHPTSSNSSPVSRSPQVATVQTLQQSQHVVAAPLPAPQASAEPQQPINAVPAPKAPASTNDAVPAPKAPASTNDAVPAPKALASTNDAVPAPKALASTNDAVAPGASMAEAKDAKAVVVPVGLGRGAKNLGALMQQPSTKVEEDSNSAAAANTSGEVKKQPGSVAMAQNPVSSPSSASNRSSKDDGDELSQSTGSGRRGKGFGTKNLAAMRARSTKQTPEESGSSGDANDQASTADIANMEGAAKAATGTPTGAKNLAAIKARSTENMLTKPDESGASTTPANSKAKEGKIGDEDKAKSNTEVNARTPMGANNLAAIKARSVGNASANPEESRNAAAGTSNPVSEEKANGAKAEDDSKPTTTQAATAGDKDLTATKARSAESSSANPGDGKAPTDSVPEVKKDNEIASSKDETKATSNPELTTDEKSTDERDSANAASVENSPEKRSDDGKADPADMAKKDGDDKAKEQEAAKESKASAAATAELAEETKNLETDSKVQSSEDASAKAESKSTTGEDQGDVKAGKSSTEEEKAGTNGTGESTIEKNADESEVSNEKSIAKKSTSTAAENSTANAETEEAGTEPLASSAEEEATIEAISKTDEAEKPDGSIASDQNPDTKK